MRSEFAARALDEFIWWQQHDDKLAAKIEALIADILARPYAGLGKPEPLRHELSGYWSRRINKEHRLVYRIQGDTLFIYQCRFHYGTK